MRSGSARSCRSCQTARPAQILNPSTGRRLTRSQQTMRLPLSEVYNEMWSACRAISAINGDCPLGTVGSRRSDAVLNCTSGTGVSTPPLQCFSVSPAAAALSNKYGRLPAAGQGLAGVARGRNILSPHHRGPARRRTTEAPGSTADASGQRAGRGARLSPSRATPLPAQ